MADISDLDMRNPENVMGTNVIGKTPNSRFRWSTTNATESIEEPRENVMTCRYLHLRELKFED
jgi:hypothetical protein